MKRVAAESGFGGGECWCELRATVCRFLSTAALAVIASGLTHCASVPDRPTRLDVLEQGLRLELDRQRDLLERLGRGLASDAPNPDARAERPYYEFTWLEDGFTESQREGVVFTLGERLDGTGIRRVVVVRGEQTREFHAPWQADEALGELPLQVLVAALTAARVEVRGAEMDLWLVISGERHAVTARSEIDRSVVIEFPRVPADLGPLPTPSGEELSEAFGVGDLENGDTRWTVEQRGVLALAFELLTPAELATIRGLPFRREASSSPDQPPRSGLYRSEGEERSIELYDSAFAHDDRGFVGDPNAPRRASLRVVLHEVGHAISRFPGWQLWLEVKERYGVLGDYRDEFNALGRRVPQHEMHRFERMQRDLRLLNERWNRARPELEASAQSSPVLADYAAATGGRGPTEYGRESLGEAFAEAFALSVLDPAALERIDPAALAFFESGAHLPAVKD